MSEEFSAFKAMAFGLGAIFVVASIAPDVTGGRFDPLRLRASKDGGSGRHTKTQTCPDGSVISATSTCPTPTPTPRPTPTPTPTPIDTTNGVFPEATMVASNFDVSTALQASWGSGAIAPTTTDVVGAFRFICGAGPLMYDDPIVRPGEPGTSHLHQYYGNSAADANSTFDTLRASGDSTCNNMGNGTAANRSAYWMPALFDGKGHVVVPDYVQVYYKREPLNSSACDPKSTTRAGICVPIPNGLRFISGYKMTTMTQGPMVGQLRCGNTVWKANVEGLTKATNTTCPIGTKLELSIQSAKCWNGQLDSADHMSHLSPQVSNASTGWKKKCPSTHPYLLPQFTISSFYTIRTGDDVSLWTLSSDMKGMPRGSSLHFDYFEAWDNSVKSMWMDNCIGKKLNCSGGDLGNGKQLRGAAHPVYGWTNPNPRVAIP